MSIVLGVVKLVSETRSAFVGPVTILLVCWDELSRNLSSLDVISLGYLMALTVK
jgi:hypothetical protein